MHKIKYQLWMWVPRCRKHDKKDIIFAQLDTEIQEYFRHFVSQNYPVSKMSERGKEVILFIKYKIYIRATRCPNSTTIGQLAGK